MEVVHLNEPLKLACGYSLTEHVLCVETYGELNRAKSNAVLICHALTGSHHAAGWRVGDKKPGWWDDMIGPGKSIDTDQFFVVSPSNIGTCHGSTGPLSINPKTNSTWGPNFPKLHISDWTASQRMLMDHYKIKCWAAVVGGSLGGMQAMHWSVTYPDRLLSAVVIASAMKLSAQNIAFNEIARRAIKEDIDFHGGHYQEKNKKPSRGLALARMIGHVTYLSDLSMAEKFGREVLDGDFCNEKLDPVKFKIESYLNYQGDKFANEFDANSYILLTKMLDYFDLARKYDNQPSSAFRVATCKFLVLTFSSDWRFPPERSREITKALITAGCDVTHAEITSSQGHDAFLLPDSRYQQIFSTFMKRIASTLHC
jgi:homoserine O-acetyltransferase